MENSTAIVAILEAWVTAVDPIDGDGPSGGISTSDLIEILILSSIALVGVIGNLLVVSVYSEAKGQQTNAALYIFNLAAADLLTLGAIAVLEITEQFKVTWPILWRYDIQCQLYRIGRFLCLDVTVFLMMAIAIDRYIAVVHPLKYKITCTPKRTKRLLSAIWIISVILATPVGINFMTVYGKPAGPAHGVCGIRHLYTFDGVNFMGAYIALFLMFIPAFTTGIVYSVLVINVRNHNAEFATQGQGTSRMRKNHWKMAKILMAVYFGYIFFYSPYLLFYFTEYIGRRLPLVVRKILLDLPYANSCVNPVIYVTMNRNFRAMLHARYRRRPGADAEKPVVESISSSSMYGSRESDRITSENGASASSSVQVADSVSTEQLHL